jgi:phospholipase C
MKRNFSTTASAIVLSMLLATNGGTSAFAAKKAATSPQDALATATPIRHVVIIFGENISFDHYFGTYPNALTISGEPSFVPAQNTPTVINTLKTPFTYSTVNGVTTATPVSGVDLINNNPNLNSANGTGATNPIRLDRSQALTTDQSHSYGPEQSAFDGGKNDLFPKDTGTAEPANLASGIFATKGIVMGYFDGNTVTGLWNYAQHFALNDNSYSSQFGPSSPGAINVISGQTNGAIAHNVDGSTTTTATGTTGSSLVNDGQGGLTMFGDGDPFSDVCSTKTSATTEMTGKNIGDLLNAKNITWGWFQGGFNLQAVNANGTTGCSRSTFSATVGGNVPDYVQHHAPFQYYATTRNPNHTRPSSIAAIGTSKDGGANHQYDIDDFFSAVAAGNFPSVSYLKAPAVGDAHPGNSDPLDEQAFVVKVINSLQQSPDWDSTAVIIAYDDSDGWYDHANNVINPSASVEDAFTSTGVCNPLPGTTGALTTPLNGLKGLPVQGRCGYGTRQPLMVISPLAKPNFVDHTLTDQSSIVRFIEDNWLGGERIGQGSYDAIAGTINNMFDFTQTPNPTLILDPTLGTPTQAQ